MNFTLILVAFKISAISHLINHPLNVRNWTNNPEATKQELEGEKGYKKKSYKYMKLLHVFWVSVLCQTYLLQILSGLCLVYFFFFFLLHRLASGILVPSARDRTQALCRESGKSQPLAHQGIPFYL